VALKYTSSFDKTIGYTDVEAQMSLTVGVAIAYTLPGTEDQKFVLTFGTSSNANIFMGYNVTPAVPAANTLTQVARVEFITPDCQRYARGGDVITVITPDATAYLGISVRSITN
jgi:hypothetical protein